MPSSRGSSKQRSAGTELILLMLFAAIPALITFGARTKQLAAARDTSVMITVEQAIQEARVSNILWVDARSEPNFDRGHIPGARRLTPDDWEDLLPEIVDAWMPSQTTVVYCDETACNTSTEVAVRLQRELNMGNVYVLEGGWQAWKLSKHPTEP